MHIHLLCRLNHSCHQLLSVSTVTALRADNYRFYISNGKLQRVFDAQPSFSPLSFPPLFLERGRGRGFSYLHTNQMIPATSRHSRTMMIYAIIWFLVNVFLSILFKSILWLYCFKLIILRIKWSFSPHKQGEPEGVEKGFSSRLLMTLTYLREMTTASSLLFFNCISSSKRNDIFWILVPKDIRRGSTASYGSHVWCAGYSFWDDY